MPEEKGHLVTCAKHGCPHRFLLTRENAFQRYCPEHQGEQKPADRKRGRQMTNQ
ncbi:MAG TPA: hypothetical protein VIZ18_05390 [Ktedonobacteraceae bacterium]